MKILVLDVGGTNLKLLATGQTEPRKVPTGPEFTPAKLVAAVQEMATDWSFDALVIGYPGPVMRGQPIADPVNLGPGWVGFDFEIQFGRPVKLINDAAMQALGSYEGGRMLFLGLGTGLGSAMVVDGLVEPMELAHLPYKKATFEDYIGLRGLKRLGSKKWRHNVADVVERLSNALKPDYVVLGGGNVKKLKELPPGTRAGNNANAFLGGFKLWEMEKERNSRAPAKNGRLPKKKTSEIRSQKSE
jgi:polyphosphate glucokinase